MNATDTPKSDEQVKIYPGSLDRYRELRANREAFEASNLALDPEHAVIGAGLNIAEQLAGLAYILDGIRYAARKS